MTVTYTDEQIAMLIKERKQLPEGWREKMVLRPKHGHKEYDLDILGEHGTLFRLKLRQSMKNLSNFSAILAVVRHPKIKDIFLLLRYNGQHAPHTNHIEGSFVDGCHIHRATERYQKRGFDEETYAEATNRYIDLDGAQNCLFEDAGFDLPPGPQSRLL